MTAKFPSWGWREGVVGDTSLRAGQHRRRKGLVGKGDESIWGHSKLEVPGRTRGGIQSAAGKKYLGWTERFWNSQHGVWGSLVAGVMNEVAQGK